MGSVNQGTHLLRLKKQVHVSRSGSECAQHTGGTKQVCVLVGRSKTKQVREYIQIKAALLPCPGRSIRRSACIDCVHDRLKIASVPLVSDCAVRDGEAKTFSEDPLKMESTQDSSWRGASTEVWGVESRGQVWVILSQPSMVLMSEDDSFFFLTHFWSTCSAT